RVGGDKWRAGIRDRQPADAATRDRRHEARSQGSDDVGWARFHTERELRRLRRSGRDGYLGRVRGAWYGRQRQRGFFKFEFGGRSLRYTQSESRRGDDIERFVRASRPIRRPGPDAYFHH